MSYVKVVGRDDLVRDSVSGAIVSKNKDEYQTFMNQYKSRISLENRVNNLESKLDKILATLEKGITWQSLV